VLAREPDPRLAAARSTVQKELSVLSRALTLAKARGLFLGNPRALIPRFRVRSVPRDRWLTQKELRALLNALPKKRRPWVLLSVLTGAGKSEVEAIDWSGVDLVRGWVLIPGTKRASRHRRVPISPTLRRLLVGFRAKQRVGRVVVPWGNVRRDLQAACREAGVLPEITTHDLRRTFASWLAQRGVGLKTIANLLGHSSTRMVDRVYGHLSDATYQAAVKKLPALRVG
jgi:integrase